MSCFRYTKRAPLYQKGAPAYSKKPPLYECRGVIYLVDFDRNPLVDFEGNYLIVP